MGLLVAFDLPGPHAAATVKQALQEGLLINAPQPATIRLMPPLIASRADIDRMTDILKKILDKSNI